MIFQYVSAYSINPSNNEKIFDYSMCFAIRRTLFSGDPFFRDPFFRHSICLTCYFCYKLIFDLRLILLKSFLEMFAFNSDHAFTKGKEKYVKKPFVIFFFFFFFSRKCLFLFYVNSSLFLLHLKGKTSIMPMTKVLFIF